MIYISLVAIVFGGLTWFFWELKAARIDAVRQAYMSGRLTEQEARDHAGDRVDAWPKPAQSK